MNKRSAGLVWMCVGTALFATAYVRYVAGGHPVFGTVVFPILPLAAWISFFAREWSQRQEVRASILGSLLRYDGNAWHLVVAGALMLGLTIFVNEPSVAETR